MGNGKKIPKSNGRAFSLEIRTTTLDEYTIIDHMEFSNCCLVKLFIDGENIAELFPDNEPLIVFQELLRSTYDSRDYLIFTCVSGIADDGGWKGVSVFHDDLNVNWGFEYEDDIFMFAFEKQKYIDEIFRMKTELEKSNYVLEPTWVAYPESWGSDQTEEF